MFTNEEVTAAKATRDAIISENISELKSIYMAGEIVMWDEMQAKNLHKAPVSGSVAYDKVSKLLSALNDIRNWDDDLEDKWEDPGYRAKAALAEYYKATDR